MKSAIQLSRLRLDGGTQPRVKIDTDVVDEYAERIKAGDDFPPVEVFFDGAEHWLAEGFHRYHAHAKAGKKTVACNIRKGTVRDAILFSCGANISHGLRRTNADKRRAVETLLKDDEWAKYSNRRIAELCCVSDPFVAEMKNQLLTVSSSHARTIGKDGKSRPSTQPKRQAVISAVDDYEPEQDYEPAVAVASKPKSLEPNVIGHKRIVIGEFIDEELDGVPAHIRMAIADFLEDKAAELRK